VITIVKKAKPFSISMKDEDKDRLVSYCSTNNLNRSAFVNDVVNRAMSVNYCSSNNQMNTSFTCNTTSPDHASRMHRERVGSLPPCRFNGVSVENGDITYDHNKRKQKPDITKDETDEND
jgi:hypothetical protein